MDVNAVSAAGSVTNRTGNAPIRSDFETFLKMLTTQMQNQDPLNPMESTDFAVQLATFSGVEQQVRSNQLLEALVARMGAMGMAEFAGWVGMEARVTAPVWFDGAGVTIAPQPAVLADQAVLLVRDESGTVVQRLDMPIPPGVLTWAGGVGVDGNYLPAGRYSFDLESYAQGALIAMTPVEAYATITEVRHAGGEITLLLQGGAEVAASAVTALRKPGG